MKKIVYIVGGVYGANGMSQVLTQKINWLACNTDSQLFMVLTERPDLPSAYDIAPVVSVINFGINFDELDTMPLVSKLLNYRIKQAKYKKLLVGYLMKVRADVVVSACRREINFINDIQDGSHKVGEIHFGRSHYRQFYKPWLPKVLCQWISRQWIGKFIKEARRLDRFVVLSKEDSKNWPELANMTVISNALKHLPTVYSPCISKRVIAVGRYTWQKGFDLLLQAWRDVQALHPDWQLHIYGSGDSTAFRHLALTLGVDKTVVCHGEVDDVYREYQSSSILVLSSRYEGFGLVLAEAMSCGLPVVSFACPCGPSDIITDGKDGFLVPTGDCKTFAEKINYLIGHPSVMREIGKNASESAGRFSIDKIMPQWVELFKPFRNKNKSYN